MALGGFFSRLKEGLSRSTQKLSGGITAVFKKRRLDDEALEELEELLISADLGTEAARTGDRRVPPHPVRQGSDRRGDQAGAGRGDRRDSGAGRAAVGTRSGAQAARGAGGRRQRHRQDDDDRQAGAAVSRAGQAGGDGGRRHVPRGGGGAIADLGRAHGDAGGGRGAERGLGGAGVRRADARRRRTAPTCC